MVAPMPPAGDAPRPAPDQIMAWLSDLPDPEIPVISITDLGIVREIGWEGGTLVVAVTPTYSGCPATAAIELAIDTCLRGHGIADLRIDRRLSPPWTTDWLTPAARDRLRAYGIAPPVEGTAAAGVAAGRAARLAGGPALVVPCPRCGAPRTERISRFGSTPCKASYRCRDCLEPFDYFKCH